ncbi:MAG: TRAP transporter substrate-binding protein DctP [Alphaproteobacteria bacterium]
MKRWHAAAALAVAMSLAGTAPAQEAKLRAASFLPVTVNYGAIFKRWVDVVNERGKGIVQITVVGPEAIPTFEQWNALQTGVVDMHAGPPAYYTGTMIEGEAAILADIPVAEQRKNGALAYLNKMHNEKLNAWLLTAYADGVGFHVYTTKPQKAGDKPFEGYRLRSAPNFKRFFEELGATPVTLAPGDVFTALERNVVEGYGWPRWGIQDMGWAKITKFRYDPGFFNVICNIMVNLDRWNKLTKQQQDFLTEMSVWLEGEWPKWRDEINRKEADIQERAGVKVVDMGPAFRQKAHDIYWAALTQQSPQHVPALRKLLTKP